MSNDTSDKASKRAALDRAELAAEEAGMALRRAEDEADAIRKELHGVQARHSAAVDALYQRNRELGAAQEALHRLQMAANAEARAEATARFERQQAAFLARNSAPLPRPPSGGDDGWE